ncbi:MAG: lasso peptide biosynthesis B2 protein [Gammaproteobacteria bacterium]
MTFRHYLAPHVRACSVRGHVVLLDVKKDEYIGVSTDQSAALASAIAGWPRSELPVQTECEPSAIDSCLQEFQQSGLIVSAPPSKCLGRDTPAVPLSALIDGYSEHRVPIAPRDVILFAAACIRARVLLRLLSFEKVTRRVYLRGAHAPVNLDLTRSRVAVFRRLRPLLFTSKGECLFESLAMSEFLAFDRIFPLWVFGVDIAPFAAHCWLQAEDTVLNDTPEEVCRYTPILVL